MGSRYAVKTLLLFGAIFPWCVAVALAQTPGGYVPDTAWRPAAGVASGTPAPASPASLSPVFTPPAAAAGNPFLAPPPAVARRSTARDPWAAAHCPMNRGRSGGNSTSASTRPA